MCQRLSMATTAAMIEPGRSGLVTGHEFAATQGSGEFDAVSYTHLDVYKRQSLNPPLDHGSS